MARLIFFVLFMALCIRHSSASYCLCKDGVDSDELQKALDYACGFGADCGPIQPNGPCYEPNTVKDHCDYAVNSYYLNMHSVGGTCDFAGAATSSPTPPTKISTGCVYPSGPGYVYVSFIMDLIISCTHLPKSS
ncbi:PREDICTED: PLASMODESMATA CALLOSE-BINDING PROTEIN 3-like [Lupinus angustifolius]|uniref:PLASMODESMATA CALLOSE-BINDING PROTEIN 3-like n=1 Tax=Lupinus angustifolius TaxID=3871 RepID=UPI00092E7792|nr:PREDICTED: PLASMODESMATA CALLOSE-BINDING PROTEIN 3-like [Lupinus angustifolius]